jgi:signal transduction histidine kinase
MLRSLRARLLVLTAAVAGVALVAAALISRQAVQSEFQRLETRVRGQSLSDAAELLSARLAAPGAPSPQDSTAMDSATSRLAASLGQDLLLVAGDGRVLAASTPGLRSAQVRPRGGFTQVDRIDVRDGVHTLRRALISLTHPAIVRAPGGESLGVLLPFPRETEPGLAREPEFLLAVNRWLLIAVLGAGVLALLLSVALSRRILGPIEALTGAARRMESGDLGQRIEIRSRDEIGELAHAFNAMAASLERNETLRRALVTDVAHELRTPLTNLRCQIEALEDGLAKVTAEALRSLQEETSLLTRLVEDLQDLALAEAGQLPLHLEPIPLERAIREALAAIAPRAAEKQITLEPRVDSGLPEALADPLRLAQILRNLLDNALTHTPEHGRITVSATRASDALELAVEDSGTGIAPEHLSHVFDRFYRADPSRARSSGGAGLGLAIVRQLAVAHGGEIRAESPPGRGARFALTIPIARSS